MKLKKFKTLDGFERGGALLRASRSGKVLVACDVACRAWDTRTWKVIGEIEDVEEDDGPVGACDLTPDGSLLAVGDST